MAKTASLLIFSLVYAVIGAATASEYIPPIRRAIAAAPEPAEVLVGETVESDFFVSTCSLTCNPSACSAAVHRLGNPGSIGTPYRLAHAILNQTVAEVKAVAASLRQLKEHTQLKAVEYAAISSCADLLYDGALQLHRSIHELIFVKQNRELNMCRLTNTHAMASAPVVEGESCVYLLNGFLPMPKSRLR